MNKKWLLLALGGIGIYLIYQRSAKASEQSKQDQAAYIERLRQVAIRQRAIEAARNRAVISQDGNIVPPPVAPPPPIRGTPSMPDETMHQTPKYGPIMVP